MCEKCQKRDMAQLCLAFLEKHENDQPGPLSVAIMFAAAFMSGDTQTSAEMNGELPMPILGDVANTLAMLANAFQRATSALVGGMVMRSQTTGEKLPDNFEIMDPAQMPPGMLDALKQQSGIEVIGPMPMPGPLPPDDNPEVLNRMFNGGKKPRKPRGDVS